MNDQRNDDETLGRALGRAVESQTVRETPYAASRLAHRIDRPAGRGWTYALPVAAALALFVAMGAFFAGRGPQGVATPDASATPTVSATSGPSVQPTAVPASCAPELTRVFFARDQLPPVAGMVRGTCGGRPGVVDQISGRLTALLGARPEDVPSGAFNATGRAPTGGRQSTTSTSMTVDGDLATVEIGVDPAWAARGAAQSQALVQQLIYTITEVPGIRRAKLKDPGKQTFTIDQLVVDKPLTREDVFGYARSGAADRIESGGTVVPATLSAKVDYVQTGGPGQPVRLVIDLAPRQPVAGGSWLPDFVASIRQASVTSTAKYELEVAIKGGTDTTTLDQVIEVTPLRYVAVQGTNDAMTYRLGLDDARPWRVSITPWQNGAMRLYVDIGGVPGTVNQNIAVYSPINGQTVIGSITIAGAARVFEANVVWRLRDASGREVANGFTTATNGTSPVWGSFQTSAPIPAGLSGQATLEVFWGSPRDGSAQDVVSLPLTIR